MDRPHTAATEQVQSHRRCAPHLPPQIDLINFAAALADAQGWVAASAGRRQLAWQPPSEQQEADEAATAQRRGSAQRAGDVAAAGLRREQSRRHQRSEQAAGSLSHGEGGAGQPGRQQERQQVPCPWPRRVNRRIS